MLLAAVDYPLLNIFWSMLFFFIWVSLIMIVFRVFGDLFRRDDMSGLAKASWMILVILAPFLGVFIYMISQGSSMAQRNGREVRAQQSQFDARVQSAASSGGVAGEIEKAKSLLDSGAITQSEFETLKAAALA
jgi:Short C-terminal domain